MLDFPATAGYIQPRQGPTCTIRSVAYDSRRALRSDGRECGLASLGVFGHRVRRQEKLRPAARAAVGLSDDPRRTVREVRRGEDAPAVGARGRYFPSTVGFHRRFGLSAPRLCTVLSFRYVHKVLTVQPKSVPFRNRFSDHRSFRASPTRLRVAVVRTGSIGRPKPIRVDSGAAGDATGRATASGPDTPAVREVGPSIAGGTMRGVHLDRWGTYDRPYE